MNLFPWLFLILAAFPLTQLILDYRVKYVVNDGRTTKHKSTRKLLLAIALASVIANPLAVWFNNSQSERKAESARATHTQQLTNLHLNFQSRISIVDSNQERLREEIQNLSMAMATNPAISFETRSQILDVGRGLQAVETNIVNVASWISDLHKERALRRLEISKKEQSSWEEGVPVYSYAMRKFETALVEVGKLKGEQVFSDIRNLPPLMPSLPFDFASLRTGSNSVWKFHGNVNWHAGHTQLTVSGSLATSNQIAPTATMRIQV